jgi:GNAT superfamily N-acetyltransferase
MSGSTSINKSNHTFINKSINKSNHKNKYKNNSNKKSKRKIYRKKRKTFKLRGGTYLNDRISPKISVRHPLQHLVKEKSGDNYAIHLNHDNVSQINYDDIFTQAFFDKFLEILNFSFEKERKHSISKGIYSEGYVHNLDSVRMNIENPRFHTYILTSENLTPISFLYVERIDSEDDYDKVWTVCTDPAYRGKGMSSKMMNHMTVDQLNQNRGRMLLEVFNDHVISRDEEDVKQSQIMNHFQKNGFVHTPLEELSSTAQNNVIHPTGNTKIMIFKPENWYHNNRDQGRNLNHKAKQMCNHNNK